MQQRNDRAGVLQRSVVRRVWVDLETAFLPGGTRYGRGGRGDPDGVDLSLRAPGELLAWHRTTTGEWVGWGSVTIMTAGQTHQVWTYLLAAALSPRDDIPNPDTPSDGGV